MFIKNEISYSSTFLSFGNDSMSLIITSIMSWVSFGSKAKSILAGDIVDLLESLISNPVERRDGTRSIPDNFTGVLK